MSTKEINIKTVIAVLLLIVDVLAIRWFVDAITENKMHHHMSIVSHYSGMQLTLNKDITGKVRGKTVTVPAGTVVKPNHISLGGVVFSYSDEFASFRASYEDFEEQAQLEELRAEAEQIYNKDREMVIKKNIGPGIVTILCGILICSLVTFFLVKNKWYALLYVLDILFFLLQDEVFSLLIQMPVFYCLWVT